MSTRTIMIARIADEMDRSDLTTQIGNAIDTAIQTYEGQRFWFNESTDTYTTTSGTDKYAQPSDLILLDSLVITVNGRNYPLSPRSWGWYQDNLTDSSITGQPHSYTVFKTYEYLYPIPDNTYTVTRAYIWKLVITNDTNAWYVEAEPLIRTEAKRILNFHVIRDLTEGQKMQDEAARLLTMLKNKTVDRISSGRVRGVYL